MFLLSRICSEILTIMTQQPLLLAAAFHRLLFQKQFPWCSMIVAGLAVVGDV